jgi:preprotein translocase subunit SecE
VNTLIDLLFIVLATTAATSAILLLLDLRNTRER